MDWKSDRHRIDVEFGAFNALKTIFGLSKSGDGEPSTSFILEQARQISPEIFDDKSLLLKRTREPQLIREYQQRANFESRKTGKSVSAYELVKKDLSDYTEYLSLNEDADNKEADDAIREKHSKLKDILPRLKDIHDSENEFILRDIDVERSVGDDDLPVPPLADGRCRVYAKDDSLLKIRRLHPDRAEHLTGADLIYERYDIDRRLVRLAYVQYKIWDDKNIIYFSQGNVTQQIDLLSQKLCKTGTCHCEDEDKFFRLPYCSAFLRPTNRQQPNSTKNIVSRGFFIPVCRIEHCLEPSSPNNWKLTGDGIKDRALNQDLFETLFNRNMVGSKWLTYDEVESFYQDNEILQSGEKLIYHAQDYDFE